MCWSARHRHPRRTECWGLRTEREGVMIWRWAFVATLGLFGTSSAFAHGFGGMHGGGGFRGGMGGFGGGMGGFRGGMPSMGGFRGGFGGMGAGAYHPAFAERPNFRAPSYGGGNFAAHGQLG